MYHRTFLPKKGHSSLNWQSDWRAPMAICISNRKPRFTSIPKVQACFFKKNATPSVKEDNPVPKPDLFPTSSTSIFPGLSFNIPKLSPGSCLWFSQPTWDLLEARDRSDCHLHIGDNSAQNSTQQRHVDVKKHRKQDQPCGTPQTRDQRPKNPWALHSENYL